MSKKKRRREKIKQQNAAQAKKGKTVPMHKKASSTVVNLPGAGVLKGVKAFVVPAFGFNVNRPIAGDSEVNRWAKCMGCTVVESAKEADIIFFTGGPDINSALYGQPSHSRTSNNPMSRRRDMYESVIAAIAKDKLKIGICRGAQLLNVLSGGSIIQHVSKHTTNHSIVIFSKDGKSDQVLNNVTSTHHQMMLPSPTVKDRDIIAVAYDGSTNRPFICPEEEKLIPTVMEKERENFFSSYTTSDFDARNYDAEVIWYKNTNSLCIQGHPERFVGKSYGVGSKEFTAFCAHLIRSKYDNVLSKKLAQELKA